MEVRLYNKICVQARLQVSPRRRSSMVTVTLRTRLILSIHWRKSSKTGFRCSSIPSVFTTVAGSNRELTG